MPGACSPAGLWLPGMIHSCGTQEQGLKGPLRNGSKKIRPESPCGARPGGGGRAASLGPSGLRPTPSPTLPRSLLHHRAAGPREARREASRPARLSLGPGLRAAPSPVFTP